MSDEIIRDGLVFRDNGGIWLPVASSDTEGNAESYLVDGAIDLEATEVAKNWLANFKTVYYKGDPNLNDGTVVFSQKDSFRDYSLIIFGPNCELPEDFEETIRDKFSCDNFTLLPFENAPNSYSTIGDVDWSRRGQECTEERVANLLYRVYRESDLFNIFTFIARFVIWRYLLEADIEQGDMPPDVLPDSNMERYLRAAEHSQIGGIRFMPNGYNC